jgi:hypothetical protein
MKAIIEVSLDSDSFKHNPGELARILRELSEKIECGVTTGDSFSVHDVNGTPVGTLKVSSK